MAQPAPGPDASLEGLPQELVVRIASFLSTAELGPLRRSCRNIERQLFDTFAHEFFTKRQFMLEHESLAALVGISRHPGLASRLSEVIISTHVLALSERLLRQRLESGHVEREVLLCTGLARDLLVEAFSNLPNLAKVGLRDCDGAGRIRDGATARWRSWGWSLGLAARDDVPPAMSPLLLAALGHAQARPSNVEVFLRHRHLDFNSFRPTSGLPGAAVTAVLADLKTLMLAVSARSSGSQDSHDSLTPWASYEDENLVELPLRTFLHDTPQLKSPPLNVGMLFGSDADENFESAEEDSELNDDDEDDSMDDGEGEGEGEGEVGEEDVGGAGGRSSAL